MSANKQVRFGPGPVEPTPAPEPEPDPVEARLRALEERAAVLERTAPVAGRGGS